jgi:release factor glutamine methyltransferase
MTILKSDLFQQIPFQYFDIIAVNPPYYMKPVTTVAEYAWNCGAAGDYFFDFFSSVGNFIHPQSEVLMVLFEGCNMTVIEAAATKNNFRLKK